MLKSVAIAVLIGAVACASASKGRRCAPIDPELYVDYGGLYDECTVDEPARLSFRPRVDYPYAAQPNVYCVYGTLKFIVDTLGKPIVQTAEAVAGNDQRYLELMVNYLPQVRFAPGRVKNHTVHQIARWESRTAVSPTLTSSRSATTSTISC